MNERYIELKINDKVYKKRYEIDRFLIKNKLSWFIDVECENARIEIIDGTLVINSAIIYNGIIEFAVIRDADVRNIKIYNGVIYNGVFKNIIMEKGIIFNGKFIKYFLGEDVEKRGGNFLNEDDNKKDSIKNIVEIEIIPKKLI